MNLLRSTAVVSAMTLVSRILGFIRDIVVARMFGAQAGTDAFFAAFKIPNFFRRLFAEGSFALAFVPLLAEYRERGDRAAVRDLIDHVSGALLGALLLVTALGMLGANLVISLFTPGFLDDPQKFQLATEMLRITFPYLLFISLTGLAGGILNSYGRFAVPALTPALLNIALISAALMLPGYLDVPVKALAWGVFAAGVIQLLFQVPALARLGIVPRPRWPAGHVGVRRLLRLMLPTLFGSSVAQINLLIDTVVASFLVTGSLTWLYYSDRMLEFPLGIFGIALATVIMPDLSARHASKDSRRFSSTLDWASRVALVIGLPAAAGLGLLATPILYTLFQYGAFAALDVEMSALSLVAYAFGLPAYIYIKVFAPGYYAQQDTRTPVKIGVLAMATNTLLNLLFVWLILWRFGYGAHAGLALASSIAALLNATLLYRGLRKRQVFQPLPGWRLLLLRVAIAVAVMAGVLAGLVAEGQVWAGWTLVQRIQSLSVLLVAGIGSYAVVLFGTGFRIAHLRSISRN